MPFGNIKRWIGKKTKLLAVILFFVSLILYAVVYIIEKGFAILSPLTILAAIATAILLASVSVIIEQYIKANLTNSEIFIIQSCRELGIQDIHERTRARGLFASLPDILRECRAEAFIVAYAGDNFIEEMRVWIEESLEHDIKIGFLILHPKNLEQAEQTEGRNFTPQIQKALEICKQIIKNSTNGIENFKVKGYPGHLYFTGIFIDRCIMGGQKKKIKPGITRIQFKANFKTQHEGALITFKPKSRYSMYYTVSCRKMWEESEDIIDYFSGLSNSIRKNSNTTKPLDNDKE